MKTKIAIIILSATLFIGCTNWFKKKPLPIYVELEKTSCMGPCPAFKLSIFEKKARLAGISNLKNIGLYEAKINKMVADSILGYLQDEAVMSSEAKYVNMKMLDLPTTYLRFFDGYEIKEIMIYNEKPAHLMPLIELLNAQKDNLTWMKVGP